MSGIETKATSLILEWKNKAELEFFEAKRCAILATNQKIELLNDIISQNSLDSFSEFVILNKRKELYDTLIFLKNKN